MLSSSSMTMSAMLTCRSLRIPSRTCQRGRNWRAKTNGAGADALNRASAYARVNLTVSQIWKHISTFIFFPPLPPLSFQLQCCWTLARPLCSPIPLHPLSSPSCSPDVPSHHAERGRGIGRAGTHRSTAGEEVSHRSTSLGSPARPSSEELLFKGGVHLLWKVDFLLLVNSERGPRERLLRGQPMLCVS